MRVLYFAWVREKIGVPEEVVTPPESIVSVAALVDWLAERSAGHAEAFADPARLRAAVDGEFAPMAASIAGAREVAIFPPVTGG